MSKRLLTSLPIFGLSALAIGAPIPYDGFAERHVQNVGIKRKSAVLDNDTTASNIPALGAQVSLSRGPPNRMAVRMSRTRDSVGTRPTGHAATLMVQAPIGPQLMSATASAVSQAEHTLLAGQSAAPDIRMSRVMPETVKTDATIQAQPAQFAATPVTRTLNRPPPGGANGALKIPVPTNRDPFIYGTSASNAYKVYFPQEESAEVGLSSDTNLVNSQKAASDTRVLQKNGSYLFYEDAPASAEPAPKPTELTAPALQKQPLDFSNNLFQRPAQPDKAVPSESSRATAR